MTAKEQGLPELPFSPYLVIDWTGPDIHERKNRTLYTADQMRAYALAALASDTGERGVVEITVGAGVHATDLWLREVGIAGTLVYVPLDNSSAAVTSLGIAINPRRALRAHPPAQASGAVTDVMVEAACQSYSGEYVRANAVAKGLMQTNMRFALTAALAQGGGNER